MANDTFSARPNDPFSPQSILIWRVLQAAVWLVGAMIVFFLIFFPQTGVVLMWDILIPVAPALLVLAAGVWRNICPLATTSLLPRHLGRSSQRKLTPAQQARMNLIGVLALYLIVPLRHAVFNMNGWATALLLLGISAIAFGVGLRYEWKSGWCSGLCPVHPVEKLYSRNRVYSPPNAHCTQCAKCMTPCPDSTPGIHPHSVKKSVSHRISGLLMIGGFPGFVWGWFQVPDQNGIHSLTELVNMYALPMLGAAATLLAYCVLNSIFFPGRRDTPLIGIFAAAAVSCYYWFRIPALLGFGLHQGDGVLVNLSASIPAWSVTLVACASTLFFFWWIVMRNASKSSWLIRPAYVIEEQPLR